ncbi:MAG: histidine phosphatase family protein [Variovorax sp.]
MDVTRLIAIRHGETAWNVDTRIQGQLDIPLNAVGEWQAARTASVLAEEPLATVYASDLARAWRTAEIVAAPHHIGVTPEPGLRERGFGNFEGRTFAQIEVDVPDQALLWRKRDVHFAPAGGESLTLFRERITGVVDTLAARHAGQLIALVAHGGVLDVLYRAATRQDLKAPRTWQLGNCAINRLLWTSQGLTLVGWADDAHLQRSERDDAGA